MTDRAEVLQQIKTCGIVPAVRVATETQAMRAVAALAEGGIAVAEIAMSMPNALAVLQQVASAFGNEMLIGAGTVLNPEMAARCIASGARYIVTPSLNVNTIEMCRQQKVPIFAGALTPTEIETAWNAGADCVKIFPISAMGGVRYIESIRAPFPQIELLPMGGVSLHAAGDYLRAGCLAIGVGSDLVSAGACEQPDGPIARRAQAYRSEIDEARREAS